MRRTFLTLISGLLAASVLSGCMSPSGDSIAEKRQAVQNMRFETLAKLYQIHPIAKERIRKAAGYAVFSNVNINLIWLSAANGWGVVRMPRHIWRLGKRVDCRMTCHPASWPTRLRTSDGAIC